MGLSPRPPGGTHMTAAVARNYSLEEMDKQSLFHPVTNVADHLKNGPTIYSGGYGVRAKDQHGRGLIDPGPGLWCVNVGHCRPGSDEAPPNALRGLRLYHPS